MQDMARSLTSWSISAACSLRNVHWYNPGTYGSKLKFTLISARKYNCIHYNGTIGQTCLRTNLSETKQSLARGTDLFLFKFFSGVFQNAEIRMNCALHLFSIILPQTFPNLQVFIYVQCLATAGNELYMYDVNSNFCHENQWEYRKSATW